MTISPQMYKSTADTSPMTTDVIIIGGGATGAGIARDCALRGVNCVLLERRILQQAPQDGIMACYTVARDMR